MPALPVVKIHGATRRDVGIALGKLAAPTMPAFLRQSSTWAALQVWREPPRSARVDSMRAATRRAFPQLWEEFEGLAEGLGMPVDDVFLFACRGDLLHHTDDGCTTIAVAYDQTTENAQTDAPAASAAVAARGLSDNQPSGDRPRHRLIGHNEDGDPYLLHKCWIVDVTIGGTGGRKTQDEGSGEDKTDGEGGTDGCGYVSFYYPGSLPGHAFGFNRHGLVQTINNVRVARPRADGVPRVFLTRAVLDCRTLDEAVSVLCAAPRASGFHHTLACVGDPRILSVEAVCSACSVLHVRHAFGHSNHVVHNGLREVDQQVITPSSASRQRRIDELASHLRSRCDVKRLTLAETREAAKSPQRCATALDIVDALRDTACASLPIYRTAPDDPDGETNLAIAVFDLPADSSDQATLKIFCRDPVMRRPSLIIPIPAQKRNP